MNAEIEAIPEEDREALKDIYVVKYYPQNKAPNLDGFKSKSAFFVSLAKNGVGKERGGHGLRTLFGGTLASPNKKGRKGVCLLANSNLE